MKEKELPSTEQVEKKTPSRGTRTKKVPETKMEIKEMPNVGNPENTVLIGKTLVEIKPTKLKYHRTNVASFYKVVEMLPLPDIMAMQPGAFGDDRDGDKALMDWLIAVVDDEKIIVDNYNDMDTETIENILEIFRRVNRIDEKEEKQKTRRAG